MYLKIYKITFHALCSFLAIGSENLHNLVAYLGGGIVMYPKIKQTPSIFWFKMKYFP